MVFPVPMSGSSEVDEVGFLLPVGLQEDAVDVVDVDGLVGGADSLDHAADAEIAGLAQHAVGTADNQVDGGLSEGVVAELGAVEFAQDGSDRSPANNLGKLGMAGKAWFGPGTSRFSGTSSIGRPQN